MSGLSLVPIQELFEEVSKRCDTVILIGEQQLQKEGNNKIYYRLNGESLKMLELIEYVMDNVIDPEGKQNDN